MEQEIMNSINTNTTPFYGTKGGWGKIAIAWIILCACALLVKGCDNDQDHPLFIMKEVATWN